MIWLFLLVAARASAIDLQDRIVFIDDDEVAVSTLPPPLAINSTCVLAGGANGRCIKMGDCPPALKAFVRGEKLQICVDHPVNPVVCCSRPRWEPDPAPVEPPRDRCAEQRAKLKRLSSGDKATYKCIEYNERLLHPCEAPKYDLCLKPGEELVIGGGGEDAERYQFRHMALLLYGPKPATRPTVFCGGSVLSERFVLTAAHCSSSVTNGQVSTVVTGILRISDQPNVWRRNTVKRFVPHPDYASPSKYHDIALIETNELIRLDSVVVPACLHVDTKDTTLPWRVKAAGWGALGDGLGYPDALQVIPLFSANSCSAVFGPHRLLEHGFDDASQLCYGDDGVIRDTCQGDSGGPVQTEGGRCLHVVLGVTSFGRRCTTLGQPAVYTRVAHYAQWITDTVWPD